MNRRQRSEVLVRSGQEFARELADRIRAGHQVRIIQEPAEILVMLKVRESGKGGTFYLGEVMATEARVSLEGQLGLGLLQDEDADRSRDRALDLAVLDAAYAAGLPECAELTGCLETQARVLKDQDALEAARVMASKVSFQTMTS